MHRNKTRWVLMEKSAGNNKYSRELGSTKFVQTFCQLYNRFGWIFLFLYQNVIMSGLTQLSQRPASGSDYEASYKINQHATPFQNGDTALHIAAAMGRRKLTKILLESGCDKDSKNKQSETSLDISRRKNLVDIMVILQNPPPILSQQDREDQADAARDRNQHPSKGDKKREKTSTSSKENDHERSSKREKKRVSVRFFNIFSPKNKWRSEKNLVPLFCAPRIWGVPRFRAN